MNAVPFNTVMVAPISSAVPSAAALAEALKQTKIDVAILAPSIVDELASDPNLLESCAQHLECILFAGGDLPQHIGDRVATKIPLHNQFGSTELGLVPLLLPKSSRRSDEWKYLEFHPDLGLKMRPLMGEQHELCASRQAAVQKQQLPFTYRGHMTMDEYATGDVFLCHPNDSSRWKWKARRDDILVFLNGEKTNPISMERQLIQHPIINGALVVGEHRLQAALLLEIKAEQNTTDRDAIVEELWPTIEEANDRCPTHARIAKSHVLLVDPVRPMRRSGKDTIQRAATVELYSPAIEELYRDNEAEKRCVLAEAQMHDPNLVSSVVLSTIKFNTGWEELDLWEDLFARGMDSLQTLNTARAIKRRLGLADLTPSLIYSHSSVAALTQVLMHHTANAGMENSSSAEENHHSERETTFTAYREMIDLISPHTKYKPKSTGHCVLLTESTGSLGIHLLKAFLESPAVSHVYCIEGVESLRSHIQEDRHPFLKRHMDLHHVTFLQADLSHRGFGIERKTLHELQERLTLVIHNAWPINLNWPVASFAPQLYGLVNLINLCSSTAASPTMAFVSSIGAIIGYQDSSRTIPEDIINLDGPAVNGYAESRYIAEHLLEYASKKLGTRTLIARLAYVPESIQFPSRWNMNEWLPSLMIGSFYLGVLPDSLGPRMSHID